jgi:DNA-binding GntR family transcriptional regulator
MPLPSTTPHYRDLSEWVVLGLLDAIRNGTIQIGERLVERDIGERLNVSRAPVRVALQRLEKLGIIERETARGFRVRQWSQRDAVEIFLLLDSLILLSVYLSVGRLRPEDIAELDSNLDQTRINSELAEPDLVAQSALNLQFHLTIARASGHRRLIEQMETLILPLELWPHSLEEHKHPKLQLRHHLRLLNILKDGTRDEAVACVMENIREDEEPKLRAFFANPMSKSTI